jgi:hypothetical protein
MGMGRAAEGSEDVGRAMIRGAADRGEYRQPAGAASEKCPRPPGRFHLATHETNYPSQKIRFRPAH